MDVSRGSVLIRAQVVWSEKEFLGFGWQGVSRSSGGASSRRFKQLSAVKSAGQKGILQRQIEATDRQIDQLVYQLYGLTDEEVALIEG